MSFGDFGSGSGGGGGGGGGGRKAFGGVGRASYQHPDGNEAEYERLLTVLTNNVKQIQYNVGRLNKMTEVLGGEKDTEEHRRKLTETIHSTRDLAKDTSDAFKKFAKLKPENAARAKITRDKLFKDFELWLTEFREVTRLSGAKERESAPRPTPGDDSALFKGIGSGSNAGLVTGPVVDAHMSEQDEARLERERAAELRRQEFEQLEQQRELERSMIEERDKGIREIETAVVTVNEIFTDLAGLVEEQGHMIDNIESNIVSTEAQTSKGTQELRKASTYQKKSRKKICYLLLCVVLLAAILAGAVFLFKGKSGKS